MNTKYIISLTALVALTGASCWSAAGEPKTETPIGSLARLYAEGPADLAPAILASLHRKDLLELAAMGCKEKNLVLRGEKESERFPNLYQDTMRELFGQKIKQFLQQHNGNVQAALINAAQNNKPWAIDYLLQNGADLNAKYNGGFTALMLAALRGHEAVAAQLIAAGAAVDEKNNYGQTALMLAARYGYEAVVIQLIAADADVNAKNIDGHTALMSAASNGHEAAVVAQLIAARADVHARDEFGRTALSLAENTVTNRYNRQAERDGARAVVVLLTRGS